LSAAGVNKGTGGRQKRPAPFHGASCVLVIVLLFASVGLVSAVSVPVITAVSPSGGPLAGGTPVTITGSGFTGTTSVRFGEIPGTALSIFNDSRLTIISPPHAEDSVFISITNAAGVGLSPYPSAMFSYEEFPVPRLSGISPSSGPMTGGTLVTITGSGFSGAGYVYIGEYGLIPTITDDNHLTVTTMHSPPGTVPVRITRGHGTGVSQDPSTMYLFEFPVPELTRIEPSSGSSAGGTVVTVTGSGFSGATNVSFGRINGTGLNIVSDNQLIIISPPNPAGTMSISVINPAHTGSSTGSATVFRYDTPLPRLTGISPSSGSSAGGTVVTLTGSGFTGTTNVSFGEKPGSGLKVIDDSRLTIISPASRLGSFPITITNGYGTGSSLGSSTSFRYVIAPDTTTTAMGTVTPARSDLPEGMISTDESFAATSPSVTAATATPPSATRSTPGFEAIYGLSALGAIILLRKITP
jgi:hypothetical protein